MVDKDKGDTVSKPSIYKSPESEAEMMALYDRALERPWC